jgi:NDP-sugar pyrophosphorylase family protein
LPSVGYCDMKEQALPLIRKRTEIKVATFSHLVCQGIRTRESYVEALRTLHGRAAADPLGENWRSDFQICETGAEVGRGARLHNSVVLRGAVIGRDAVLVRSVAFPGAVVAPGSLLVDKVISADGILNSEEVAA